jgi:hypothetical protein
MKTEGGSILDVADGLDVSFREDVGTARTAPHRTAQHSTSNEADACGQVRTSCGQVKRENRYTGQVGQV